MQTEDKVQSLLNKIQSGEFDEHLRSLEGTDLGLYLPVYEDGGTIKLMKEGYSQSETNLTVTVSKAPDTVPEDSFVVAWIGNQQWKDSTCSHSGTRSCTHCTSHGGRCSHCTGHAGRELGSGLDAPELDYPSAVDTLRAKQDILDVLAEEGIGLALLHGHNDEFTFTKLPEGYVSVVSNGVTHFRTEEEVNRDSTFVPNMWRSINGELRIAGGYSQR